MKLSYINENAQDALDYCERRVNNGSRSKFSEKYLPRKTGNPFTYDRFYISALRCSSKNLSTYGFLPDFCIDFCSDNKIYVHPDLEYYYPDYQIEETTQEVIPTSSSRTVKLLNKPYYIKLKMNIQLSHQSMVVWALSNVGWASAHAVFVISVPIIKDYPG